MEKAYKFNLDGDSFNQMLIESETFRKIVISNFPFFIEPQIPLADGLDDWRKWIKLGFPEYKKDQKISAILWLLKTLRNDSVLIRKFENAGFESNGTSIGLKAAKRFIESIN